MAINFNSLVSVSPPISLSSSFHSSLFTTSSQILFLRRSSVAIHGFGKGNCGKTRKRSVGGGKIRCGLLPVDPWAPSIDSQSVASQLFAFSLFPYLGFLYFISKVKSAPKLTRFGFYFLLAFVGATIPAGIYAKVQYGTSLSNVDWLHGGAESLLTISNLFVVLGLREALRKSGD